jgi:hypothetical protein
MEWAGRVVRVKQQSAWRVAGNVCWKPELVERIQRDALAWNSGRAKAVAKTWFWN